MRFLLIAYLTVLALLITVSAAGGIVVYRASGPDDPAEAAAAGHRYNLASWELHHFPEKWLHKLQHIFDGRGKDESDALLCAYFAADEGNQERISDTENDVEDVIEGRVTAVLKDQKLALEPPLFSDLGLVFPPVDFELDTTPRVLAVSPRDRIELRDSYLLEPDLSPGVIEEIERESEAHNAGESGVSALVIRTGGFSSYPSVVFEDASYETLIETVFHEWLHSYLIFFPLGAAYFGSDEARTLNESVANIGGEALASLYFERYGTLEDACGAPVAEATPSPAPANFDFTGEMRELRRQVEAMLAEDRIDEAESLMAAKRDEFEANGVSIRKLNQAYFAFHGSYADTPASIDPIGPKLQMLLERSGSAGKFVQAASGITSRAELDEALE